jgi:hyaluronan synthase
MMSNWMLHNAKFLGFLYWSEIIIPFWLVSVYLLTISRFAIMHVPFSEVVAFHLILAMLGSIISLFIRQVWLYTKDKKQIIYLPIILMMVSVFMIPIRIVGFFSCGFPQGWGTRKSAIKGFKNKSWKKFIPIGLGLSFLTAFYVLGNIIWLHNGV